MFRPYYFSLDAIWLDIHKINLKILITMHGLTGHTSTWPTDHLRRVVRSEASEKLKTEVLELLGPSQ